MPLFNSIPYKYSDLKILNNNPRFVDTSKIDLFSLNSDHYDFKKIAIKTLEYEGDFNEFVELIEQLQNGYNPALDQIFVLNSNNSKFVLEGNRRIIAINFLKNSDLCKEIIETIMIKNNLNDTAIRNCNRIIKISKTGPLHDNFDEISVMEIKVTNDVSKDKNLYLKEIFSVIFTRHAGENKGKRGWSRALYLVDLKNFFLSQKKLNMRRPDIYEHLSTIFNKSVSTINLDVQHALCVTKIFEYAGLDILSKNNQIRYYSSISSLELCFSTISLKFGDGTDKTIANLCEIKADIDEWNLEIKKINKNIFCKFLLENVNEHFNTRGWKNEDYYLLKDFITKNIDDKNLQIKDFKTTQTFINEAKSKNENNRTKIEKELILFEKNLKEISNEILNDKTKQPKIDEKISKSIKKLWTDNADSILWLFREKEKDEFPFLIGATIIRSIEELIATFLFVYNSQWREWIKTNANSQKPPDKKINKINSCSNWKTAYRLVVKDKYTSFIYPVYKEKTRSLTPSSTTYSEISKSLSNSKNWDRNFNFLSTNTNFNTWIMLIGKYSSSANQKLNEIIHKYYVTIDVNDDVLSELYALIGNIMIEISKLIGTLFE